MFSEYCMSLSHHPSDAKKSAKRVSPRTTIEEFETLKLAADLSNFGTVNEFVKKTALDAATQIIMEKDQWRINVQTAAEFFDVLVSPKKPTAQLKQALKEFDKERVEDGRYSHSVTRQKKS